MRSLLSRMAYRGPDSSQTWTSDRVLLGHRRLSIIDLSAAGGQPLHAEAEGLHVVYNGEIYNYRELRRELEGHYHFRTETDTEVLLAAYARFGPDFVSRLRGMFAFLLVDDRAGTVMLARDRLGKKPLYYALDDDRLIAVSEIKGLHAFQGTELSLDAESVEAFFTLQYIPGPFTIYRDVRRVMPGQFLLLDMKSWRSDARSYWSIADLTERKTDNPVERVHAALQESVRCRLVADVEVGVLLSGGIDSTLVSWYAQQEADQPLRAFTVAFGTRDLDESPYARAVASALGMPIILEDGEGVDSDMFERVVFHADEPLGDPACIPTYAVARALAQHVKVVLSGEGADELFLGYPHYRRDRLLGWIPTLGGMRDSGWLGRLGGAMEESPHVPGAVARLQKVAFGQKALGAARWTSVFGPRSLRNLLGSRAESWGGEARFVHQFEDWATALKSRTGRSNESSLLDLAFWLPDDLLTKVDRMTMAHSVEARAPFLDHHLVELAAGIPERQRASLWETKPLLRRLVREKLPSAVSGIVAERRKHGFDVPIGRWMRSELRDFAEAAFEGSRIQRAELLNVAYVRKLWSRFVERPHVESGFSRKIWLLLCFLSWHRQHGERFGFAEAVPSAAGGRYR